MFRRLTPYVSVLLFSILSGYVLFSYSKWKTTQVLAWDVYGYYNYLPALFIYQDALQFNYLENIEDTYHPTGGSNVAHYGLHPVAKTGYLCNQYPIGVAIFEMPLFFIAHAWATLTKQDVADGYSSPYQHAVALSTWLAAILGLIYLTSFLKHYFSPWIVSITVILLSFGTNFFQYAILDCGLSHIYLFLLYAAILYYTQQWYIQANYKQAILIGLCIGLAIIVRPIDLLICLIPLCWRPKEGHKIDYLKQHWKQVLLIVIVTFIATMPQLIYWKIVTHQWIYYSYSDMDHFIFDRFRVIHGLFSYRKGWFVYTPIALVGMIGFWSIPKSSPYYFYRRLGMIFFLPMLYLVFSWNNWFYGWSFGCRALIQTLPLLALPLGFMLQYVHKTKSLQQVTMALGLTFLVFLNLFQTWQYNHGLIDGTLMNETSYWKTFLQTKHNPNVDKCYARQNQIDYEQGW